MTLVHESTSSVDLVCSRLLDPAGSRESDRIERERERERGWERERGRESERERGREREGERAGLINWDMPSTSHNDSLREKDRSDADGSE